MVDGLLDDAADCVRGFFARRLVSVGAADRGVFSRGTIPLVLSCWRQAGLWERFLVRRSPAIRLKAFCRRCSWRCAPSGCTRRKTRWSRNCSRPAATFSPSSCSAACCPAATGEAGRDAAAPQSGVLARRDGLGAGMRDLAFWEDWGLPALMVLIACDLQLFLESRFAADSFKRLGSGLRTGGDDSMPSPRTISTAAGPYHLT